MRRTLKSMTMSEIPGFGQRTGQGTIGKILIIQESLMSFF